VPLDETFLAGHEGVFKGTSQLSHIPGPGVGCEELHRLRTDAVDVFPGFQLHSLEEGFRQKRDVFNPVSQGRQGDGDHIDSEEKIFPEDPRGHEFLQVLVGG